MCQKGQATGQALVQGMKREDAQARSGQFKSQRQPVQALTDGYHKRRILGSQLKGRERSLCTLDEQRNSPILRQSFGANGHLWTRERKRLKFQLMFSPHMQPLTACHHDLERGARGQQFDQEWGGADNLLEVIQYQQQVPRAERDDQLLQRRMGTLLLERKSLKQSREDKGSVLNRCQVEQVSAIRKVVLYLSRDGKRHTGFPYAAGPCDREQTNLCVTQQALTLLHLLCPAEKAGQGKW
jgi:hypothetical protein